jgi:hypothetical protein
LAKVGVIEAPRGQTNLRALAHHRESTSMPTTAQDNRLDLRSTSFIEGGRLILLRHSFCSTGD